MRGANLVLPPESKGIVVVAALFGSAPQPSVVHGLSRLHLITLSVIALRGGHVIKRLRPSTGLGLWIGSPETIFLEPCGAVLGSKVEVWDVQKALPRLQILLPKPGGWGVASLIGS